MSLPYFALVSRSKYFWGEENLLYCSVEVESEITPSSQGEACSDRWSKRSQLKLIFRFLALYSGGIIF
ncbi:MAG: hypothetical protein ACFCAD_25575 [Pleurocapsa sp.]